MEGFQTERRPRKRSLVKIISASVIAVVICGWIGIAWYFSNQIIKPAHGPATFPETVERVTTSANDVHIVSLMRSPATSKEGRYGLVWSGGSAMLGKIVLESPSRIDRIILSGALPPEGAKANMSGTYGPDPKAALGLDFQEVTVPTELGAAPAWYIPADTKNQVASPADGWAITVHGSSADRKQSLKFVPVLHSAGLSVLDITYRNDIGAPRSSDGLMHLGESEWRDLDAAVRTAYSMGAKHIVLYGGSMGGAVVLQFLTNSPLADHISGVLLEAPMLSVPRMIDNLGHVHRMPAPLTWTALQLTNWRLGFDVHRIDALRFPLSVHPPTLVLQDMADQVMPLSAARDFVSLSGQSGWRIQYAEFPNAGHGETWNNDPERCEMLIGAFLRSTTLQNK
jgi:dipeptidyl aminopeptidase/acylaminoacyl peptidase